MFLDSFLLAVKNLRHRGIRSWLTLLGIFIGVTAVVALISLGSALQVAVASQFGLSQTETISVQAGGLTMGPPGSGVVNPLTKDDLDKINSLSSVKIAAGRQIAQGKLEYNDRVVFGYATSIPSGDKRDFIYEQIEASTIDGRLLKDSDSKKVILGYNFYVDKAGLGKVVTSGRTVLINGQSFEVVGILEKKGSFIADNAVYMQEKDLEDLFNYGDKVDIISVKPIDKEDIGKTKEDIEKLLRKTRNVKVGEEDFEVSTPEASLSTINEFLTGIQIFIGLIAFISVFIGAIGIVNTMTTSVLERRKEIGIMKSIGATNSQIFLQFFIESSLLGLIGGIVGVIFGTLVGFLGTFSINSFVGADVGIGLNFGLIFFTLIGSFLIGGVAGIVPAINAAKQSPVEALRE